MLVLLKSLTVIVFVWRSASTLELAERQLRGVPSESSESALAPRLLLPRLWLASVGVGASDLDLDASACAVACPQLRHSALPDELLWLRGAHPRVSRILVNGHAMAVYRRSGRALRSLPHCSKPSAIANGKTFSLFLFFSLRKEAASSAK